MQQLHRLAPSPIGHSKVVFFATMVTSTDLALMRNITIAQQVCDDSQPDHIAAFITMTQGHMEGEQADLVTLQAG